MNILIIISNKLVMLLIEIISSLTSSTQFHVRWTQKYVIPKSGTFFLKKKLPDCETRYYTSQRNTTTTTLVNVRSTNFLQSLEK